MFFKVFDLVRIISMIEIVVMSIATQCHFAIV